MQEGVAVLGISCDESGTLGGDEGAAHRPRRARGPSCQEAVQAATGVAAVPLAVKPNVVVAPAVRLPL